MLQKKREIYIIQLQQGIYLKFDYVALGHIHKPKYDNKIVYRVHQYLLDLMN